MYENMIKSLESIIKEPKESSNKYLIRLEDISVVGKTTIIKDGIFKRKNYGYNGKELLKVLKETTTIISERTISAKNDYNLTYKIDNLYEYKGLSIHVSSFMPRSRNYIEYTFICR